VEEKVEPNSQSPHFAPDGYFFFVELGNGNQGNNWATRSPNIVPPNAQHEGRQKPMNLFFPLIPKTFFLFFFSPISQV